MVRVMAPLRETLKRERRRSALTQEELAEKAGVGIVTIRRIEQGEITEPRVSTLRKLAAALGISTRDLLEE
jgi:transcriptional regulator with XRE-family HTH domain